MTHQELCPYYATSQRPVIAPERVNIFVGQEENQRANFECRLPSTKEGRINIFTLLIITAMITID